MIRSAMSTDYTETLKRIKDTEEASNREVAEKKKTLEQELMALESESDRSIEAAKKEGEQLVATQVESARKEAEAEANSILKKASEESESVQGKKLDKRTLSRIIQEVLLSDFNNKQEG